MKVRKILIILMALCLLTGGVVLAQEAECKHDFKYRNEVTETLIYADEAKHIVIWNGAEGSYCKNCGKASWEDVYQDKLIEGEHAFWYGNVCDDCGYERTPISPDECKHENTNCEDLTERETISRNEKTHIQIWNGFKGYTCRDCYYSWIVEYHDEQVEEEHSEISGRICEYCDYVRYEEIDPSECTHENLKITYDLRDRVGIAGFNDQAHIAQYQNWQYGYCYNCDYSEGSDAGIVEVEEEHIFPNGEMKCYFCDYVKAPVVVPTEQPTAEPTSMPTEAPTVVPTVEPTHAPEVMPTAEPTEVPTAVPTELPEEPTAAPTVKPTRKPAADDGHDDVPKTGDASVVTGMYVLLAMTLAAAYLCIKRCKVK